MTPRGGPTLDFSLFGRYFLDLAVFYPGAFLCLAPLWEHVKAPRRTAVLTAALVTVICLAAAALCAIFELDSNILLLPTLLAAFWLLRWRVGPEVSVSQTAFLFAVSCVMMAVCTLLSAVLNARAEVGNDAPACLVSTSLIKLGLSAVLCIIFWFTAVQWSRWLLRANGGVEVVWRTPYDSVGAKDSREGAATTGGGLAWGGGCSPSLSRELVFFTDNLETVSLMAVDIRTGEVAASHPVIDELPANMPVSVENSAIVYDHGNGRVSTIVCNWFGAGSPNLAKPDSDSSIQSYENIYDRNWLLKGNCMIMPGVERVDTIRTADGWTMKSIWCRDDLSDTSMMKLSTATGYIYGFVQDVDSGMWQYIVLDFDTGKTVLTVDVASLYGYNNMAIGMYAGRDGNKLYCPTGYKELLRLQDRFVFLPEMPYRKVDLDKTSRRVLSAAEFQAAGGAGTPASWLHTATLDNLHPATTVSFRINGLTGNAADYKLFALGTDGRYHEVSDWHFDDAPARLSAKKVYTICLTAQDGGSFDLSPDAKEVTLSIVLAR